MLNIIRQKKESWIIKIILGFFALLFISFYGSKTLNDNSGMNPNSPAEINGTPINALKANFAIENQLENFRQQFKGTIPENFTTMIRQNVIHGLVNNLLLNEDAKKLGFATSTPELRDFIRTNPQFQQDGVFNKEFYLDKFTPWYQMTRGTSFEADVREELATKKLLETFEGLIKPSDAELQRSAKTTETKFSFSVIKIPVKPEVKPELLPKDLKAEDIPEETEKKNQQKFAEQIYSTWKSGGKIDSLLKTQKLQNKDTGELSPIQLKNIFDGQERFDDIKTLAELTMTKPFPSTLFATDNYYYLVKLTNLKTPKSDLKDEEIEKLKSDYQEKMASTLQSAWISDLTSRAKITYSE